MLNGSDGDELHTNYKVRIVAFFPPPSARRQNPAPRNASNFSLLLAVFVVMTCSMQQAHHSTTRESLYSVASNPRKTLSLSKMKMRMPELNFRNVRLVVYTLFIWFSIVATASAQNCLCKCVNDIIFYCHFPPDKYFQISGSFVAPIVFPAPPEPNTVLDPRAIVSSPKHTTSTIPPILSWSLSSLKICVGYP